MGRVTKTIIISDLHLGKSNGYLYSRENPHYETNCQALTELLQANSGFDEIVFNGDILDLALAGLDEAYEDLRHFFKLLSEAGPIKRIVWLPGNHDHHLWRMLGEQVHIEDRLKKGKEPPGRDNYSCHFVDERFSSADPVHGLYINFPWLWPKDKDAPEFVIKYPHHLLKVPVSGGDSGMNHYLITHGHFLEDLFKPVNFLITPSSLAELEAFNSWWLEALDYNLGHSGKLGQKVREFESVLTAPGGGGKEGKDKVKKVLDSAYKNLEERIRWKFPLILLKYPVRFLAKLLLKLFIKNLPKNEEGKSELRGASFDDKLQKSVRSYIETYILDRYIKKDGAMDTFQCPPKVDQNIPTPFTFVFGHTHIPFESNLNIRGGNYPVYNSGGWLQSDGDGSGNGKYAGVIVIDEAGARWKSLAGKLKR